MDDSVSIIEMEEQLRMFETAEKMCVSDTDKQIVITKAYKDALYQFYKTLFTRQMVSDFMSEGKVPVQPKNLEMLEYCKRAADSAITKPPYVLITINPRPNIILDNLKKKVEKFVKRKIVREYAYCYEVRKEDMSGLHCHLLCKYNCKPYDLKRSLQSTFKDVCDVKNPDILNIKYVLDENLKSKYDYILGEKKEDKQKGVEYSKQYRIDNLLQPLYESTPPLSCRGAEKLIVD